MSVNYFTLGQKAVHDAVSVARLLGLEVTTLRIRDINVPRVRRGDARVYWNPYDPTLSDWLEVARYIEAEVTYCKDVLVVEASWGGLNYYKYLEFPDGYTTKDVCAAIVDAAVSLYTQYDEAPSNTIEPSSTE